MASLVLQIVPAGRFQQTGAGIEAYSEVFFTRQDLRKTLMADSTDLMHEAAAGETNGEEAVKV